MCTHLAYSAKKNTAMIFKLRACRSCNKKIAMLELVVDKQESRANRVIQQHRKKRKDND